MNRHSKPTVPIPVLKTVFIILFIEATIIFAIWQIRGLWRAVQDVDPQITYSRDDF